MIGIFNRSHDKEVVVTRVHPKLLDAQDIPASLRGDPAFWERLLEDIAAFERHLTRQGTVVLKFFLNVSQKEQKSRLLDRLEKPDKYWKFNAADLDERALWGDYMDAYGYDIASTGHACATLVHPSRRSEMVRSTDRCGSDQRSIGTARPSPARVTP